MTVVVRETGCRREKSRAFIGEEASALRVPAAVTALPAAVDVLTAVDALVAVVAAVTPEAAMVVAVDPEPAVAEPEASVVAGGAPAGAVAAPAGTAEAALTAASAVATMSARGERRSRGCRPAGQGKMERRGAWRFSLEKTASMIAPVCAEK